MHINNVSPAGNRSWILLSLLALILFMCSCGASSSESTELSSKILIRDSSYAVAGINAVDIPEIRLHATLQNITRSSAELLMQNTSSKSAWTSQAFTIVELRTSQEDEYCYEIIGELPYSFTVWEDIQYVTWPESESSQLLRWDSLYGDLDSSGIYLLEKIFQNEDGQYMIGIVFTVPD